MKVIFIKDTLKNPAHKQIKSITSSYDYVDAYATKNEINYFGKLPQAPMGGYIYDRRLEGTLQSFELENLSAKKLRRLSWMDYRLIQFLQTGVYYIPQKFTDDIKKVTVEHLQAPEITEQISYKAHGEIFSSKNLAQIFEDVVANKKLHVESVHPLFEDIHILVPTKMTKLIVGSHQIRIETELHQKVTSKDILKYDELGYNWSTDGRYSIWRTKTTSINRQLFAKVLRDIDQLVESN